MGKIENLGNFLLKILSILHKNNCRTSCLVRQFVVALIVDQYSSEDSCSILTSSIFISETPSVIKPKRGATKKSLFL